MAQGIDTEGLHEHVASGEPINFTALSKESSRDSTISSKSELGPIISKTISKGSIQPPNSIPDYPASPYSNSPARSVNFNFTVAQGLTKSDSTASAGRSSIKSHVSLPVTGTIPYGGLQIHRAPDEVSEASEAESVVQNPVYGAAPMPPPKCLENGDVFLVLDLPEKSLIGHDIMAITVADAKVAGVRDVPPGAHLLWVSSPDSVFRFGYWYLAGAKGEVRIKQWNRFNELLGEPASQFEVRDKKENIKAFYPKLIPYHYNEACPGADVPPPPPPKEDPRQGSNAELDFAATSTLIWHQLTSCITKDFLDRTTGKANVNEWLVETTYSASGDIFSQQTSKIFRTEADSQLSFIFTQDLRHHIVPSLESTGGYPSDTSPRVISILNSASSGAAESDMVGELQFTFLTGMHLGNHACVQQWCYLVLRIILRAHGLVVSHPSLCRTLLRILHAQMIYDGRYLSKQDASDPSTDNANTGILDIIPGTRGKLHDALTIYKRRLNEELLGLGDQVSRQQAAVGHAFADLEAWFWRHGWDLRSDYQHDKHQIDGSVEMDSDDDYSPVIVQLDDNGREIGLVSWAKD